MPTSMCEDVVGDWNLEHLAFGGGIQPHFRPSTESVTTSNPRHWLSTFFDACVDNGGKTPADLRTFLPWYMTDDRKHQLAQPAPGSPGDHIPHGREELATVDTS